MSYTTGTNQSTNNLQYIRIQDPVKKDPIDSLPKPVREKYAHFNNLWRKAAQAPTLDERLVGVERLRNVQAEFNQLTQNIHYDSIDTFSEDIADKIHYLTINSSDAPSVYNSEDDHFTVTNRLPRINQVFKKRIQIMPHSEKEQAEITTENRKLNSLLSSWDTTSTPEVRTRSTIVNEPIPEPTTTIPAIVNDLFDSIEHMIDYAIRFFQKSRFF